MKKFENIGREPNQTHVIILDDESEVTLNIFFFSVVERWFFNCFYNDFSIYGQALSLGTLHIKEQNQPFDLVCVDNSEKGIDPFRIDDFEIKRIELVLLEREDMFDIRGFEVPI